MGTGKEMAAAQRPAGPRRAPWGSISRELIVQTALAAVQGRRGFEQMTIRSLAADMGVSPMSLYRHVRDKEDLLDEVVDRLLEDSWRPRCDPSRWAAWVTEAAERLRRFLVAQPAALHVYLQHPVVSPAAIRRMEALVEVLREGLGDDQRARHAYAAIHTYTLGFAALEASRTDGEPPEDAPGVRGSAGRCPDDPARRPPGAVELAGQLAAFTTTQQFAEGLRYLLDGIAGGHRPDADGSVSPATGPPPDPER